MCMCMWCVCICNCAVILVIWDLFRNMCTCGRFLEVWKKLRARIYVWPPLLHVVFGFVIKRIVVPPEKSSSSVVLLQFVSVTLYRWRLWDVK